MRYTRSVLGPLLAVAMLLPMTAACSFGRHDDQDGPGIAGTGTGNVRSYAARDFDGVELRGADDVEVRVGGGYSVRAEGTPDELARVRVTVEGGTLKVGRRSETRPGWTHREKVRFLVTLPRLTAAAIAGSGAMTVDRVEGQRFSGSMAGSGLLTLGAVHADDVALDIAGAGDIRAAGNARHVRIDIGGSGNVQAPGLHAAQASVSIAGAGNVRTSVAGPAKVSIMGSGDVDLGPQARCSVSKMGSGSVRCGG